MPALVESSEDPLQWRFEESGGKQSDLRASTWENDLCHVKLLAMHRPTHDPERMKAGDYPFGWHLQGRKRLWELRLQMRFKETPKEPLFFALELSRFVEISGITRQAQKALVSACQAIADCYHSNGDDPSTLLAGREAESPTFAMPLWAFDQFEVSAPGSEPDLAGNLDGMGLRRTDGASAYVASLKKALAELSTDRVYTFCFWGISQFLDCVRWEITGGILPGVTMDFDRLCGRPPVYFSIYALRQAGEEKRHLQSMKRTFFRIAAWSALHPPAEEGSGQSPVTNADFSWDGYGSFDLLDLAAPGPAAKPHLMPAEPAAPSVDLLGLG